MATKSTIEIDRTKNGTDYLNIKLMVNGKRVGGYYQKITQFKKTIDAGFFGTQGTKALSDYIELHGKEVIMKDILNRQMPKVDL